MQKASAIVKKIVIHVVRIRSKSLSEPSWCVDKSSNFNSTPPADCIQVPGFVSSTEAPLANELAGGPEWPGQFFDKWLFSGGLSMLNLNLIAL